MNKKLLPLAVAAFFGLPVASALNAEYANVSLDVQGGSDLKIESANPPSMVFGAKESKGKGSDKLASWQYITIPLRVNGKCRGDKSPNFIGELNVHVYAAFEGAGKDAAPILLDKEITYVEIPLSGKSSENKEWMEGLMNAGIFLSPANAKKILGDDKEKIELKDKLIAVAIEASFEGSNCMHPKKDPFYIVSAKYKQKLSGAWWKKGSANKQNAELLAISETPFAPFYAPTFPPTKPLYGSVEAVSGTSSAMGEAGDVSGATGDTPTDSMPKEKKSKKKAK